MERQFAVHFIVRKGLGPEWLPKIIEVGLDDIPNDMSEIEIRDMAIAEAKSILRQRGRRETEFIYKDIQLT